MKAAGYLAYQPSFTPLQGEGEGGGGWKLSGSPLRRVMKYNFDISGCAI